MSSVIDSIERRQQRQGLPSFVPGDRVRVHFQVVEGNRRRTQVFEGIVLKRQGSGARETFTVRKQSFGVGVERTFPLHSPKIEKLEIAARGAVRRAKLYYLRGRIGKAARVAERRWGIDDELISAPPPPEPVDEGPQDAGPDAEGGDAEPQPAGPVAEEDSSSSQAAGEEPTSTPPTGKAQAATEADEAEPASEAPGEGSEGADDSSEAEVPEAEAEADVEAGTDAEAPGAGETEDTAAAQDAEDESPPEGSGDSGEDPA
jgi:large subunit ribosomal protein L19